MSGRPLSPTEALIAEAMSRNGHQLDRNPISPTTAMSQDAGIDGIDVYDFASALPSQFSAALDQIPWHRFSDQRASFYGCQVLLVPVWLIYRLTTTGLCGGAVFPKPQGGAERLTVEHLAAVLDRGDWFDPAAQP